MTRLDRKACETGSGRSGGCRAPKRGAAESEQGKPGKKNDGRGNFTDHIVDLHGARRRRRSRLPLREKAVYVSDTPQHHRQGSK